MNQISPIKILTVVILFISNTLKGQTTDDVNISGLFLISASKTLEIEAKKQVTIVVYLHTNDSTFTIVEKSGYITAFKESSIVIKKRVQREFFILENVRNKEVAVHVYDDAIEENVDLKEVIGVQYNSRGFFHLDKYYSINDAVVDKTFCDCKRRKNDVLYGYQLVKVD